MRSDIINTLESYCNSFGWEFSYGNKANQNLLQSDLEASKKYFILDPVIRNKTFSIYGGSGYVNFSGSFILVVKSTIDQTYYNQTEEERYVNRVTGLDGFLITNNCRETTYKAGKYNQNIKPLIYDEIVKLEDVLNCSAYEIKEWRITDVIDLFDVNLDGILVNFKLSIL